LVKDFQLGTDSDLMVDLSTTAENATIISRYDILAISCCKIRVDKLPNALLYGLANSLYYSAKLEPCDIELSTAIRSYYGQKLIVSALLGEESTPFRQALATFLNSDGTETKEDMLGIVYKLPEFYEYDLATDALIAGAATLTEDTKPVNIEKTLHPVTRLVRRNKGTHKLDYWFKDESNQLCLLKVQGKNPLDSILKKMFEANPTMRFTARYLPKLKGKLTFFEMTNWDLLQD